MKAWKNRGGEHLVWGPYPETCDLDEDGFLVWLAESIADEQRPADAILADLREAVRQGLFVIHRRGDGAYGLSEDLEEKPQVDAPRWRRGGGGEGGAAPAAAAGGGTIVVIGGSGAGGVGATTHKRHSAECKITVLPPLPSRLRKAA